VKKVLTKATVVALAIGLCVSATACPAPGPAQKAGRKIDNALGTNN
jgi:hypothetical protein